MVTPHRPGVPVKLDLAWGRLHTRLKAVLALGGEGGVHLLPDIQPVVQVDDLLRVAKGVFAEVTVGVAAAGWTETIQVPAGKRWRLYSLRVYRVSGDNTFTSLGLHTPAGIVASDLRVAFYVVGTGVTGYATLLGTPLPMQAGEAVVVGQDGVGISATVWRGEAWVEEEDAY